VFDLSGLIEARVLAISSLRRSILLSDKGGLLRIASVDPDLPYIDTQLHNQVITAGALDPSQQLCLTMSDHAAVLCRISDGEIVARLNGHDERLVDAYFMGTQSAVVTTSLDGTLKIWPLLPTVEQCVSEAARLRLGTLSVEDRRRLLP
jgi:WD40 repeat protein